MGLASRCASVALSTGSVARPPLCHLALFSHQLHWGWRGTEGSGCQGCLGGWGCQAEMWATCAAAPPAVCALIPNTSNQQARFFLNDELSIVCVCVCVCAQCPPLVVTLLVIEASHIAGKQARHYQLPRTCTIV
eukprot:1155837-Pelagomonas_calceolata.AAC.2